MLLAQLLQPSRDGEARKRPLHCEWQGISRELIDDRDHTYSSSVDGPVVHQVHWVLEIVRGRKPTKVVWEPNSNTKITYEQHPYHPNAPDWHRDPHYHIDTPGSPHKRYVPGEDMPGY